MLELYINDKKPKTFPTKIKRPVAATGSNIANMTIPIARRVFVMTVCYYGGSKSNLLVIN